MIDSEIIDRVRLLLGDPDEEVLPTLVIQTFLDIQKANFNYPVNISNEPYVIYNTLISCLRWLIAREVTSGESSAIRRREKIGQEEIEVEFSTNTLSSWKDLLDYFEANPDYIAPELSSTAGLIIIGGVRQDEYNRVKYNPNSKDTYSSGSITRRRKRCYPYPFERD